MSRPAQVSQTELSNQPKKEAKTCRKKNLLALDSQENATTSRKSLQSAEKMKQNKLIL